MRLRLLIIVVAVSAALLSAPLMAQEFEDDEVRKIVDRIDRLYRADTSRAAIEMRIETPNWKRTLKMDIWTEGLHKTFIRISYPKKDAGMATLRQGNEMWNFFPKINKVMKVPPSMMMGSWMGSDFTNDDIVKESSLTRDYEFSLIEGPDQDNYYLKLVPREDSPIVWGKRIVTVRKSDLVPIYEEFYDEKGRKLRVMRFSEVRDFGGRRIPAVLEVIPLHKEGYRTVIRYLEAEFDVPLSAETFTLRNLQQR